MIVGEHPGPWQYFTKRQDNRGLSTEQMRQKYVKEQLLFEEFMSFQMQQQLIHQNVTVGGGDPQISQVTGGDIPAGCFQYVTDTTNNSSTDFRVTVSNDTNVTITWGDGSTSEEVATAGENFYEHTYGVSGAGVVYTVRVCFAPVENVTELVLFS